MTVGRSFSQRVDLDGDAVVHRVGGEILRIEPWGRDGLRVRVTAGPEILDAAWALTEPVEHEQGAVSIVIDATQVEIRNGSIAARLADTTYGPCGDAAYTLQEGRLQFFRRQGDAWIEVLAEKDYVVPAHNPGTRIFRRAGKGLFHSELHFASRAGERFYGMGLNATGRVDLKGHVIDLYQRHVKQVVPFVVSSEGYGFLWNNPSLGRAEFAEDRTRWISDGCRQIDYYITAGESYADILENYANATGHAPGFPEWAAGLWQCKLRYQSQEELLDVGREFARRGIPLSVLVIDILHWKHFGDWQLDPEFWPDPRAMVEELAELGIRVMVSPWTLLEEQGAYYAQMEERGLFTGTTDGGNDRVESWDPRYHFAQYDPTNPAAADVLWSAWKQNYYDLGIGIFWLDPCDDFHAIEDYHRTRFHLGPGTEVHNYFPVAHQKNIFEGLRAAGAEDVITVCRGAWAGSQRYGAAPAAHDIMSSFEHLDCYMKAGLNLAMSGIPWGASEIGGFLSAEPDTDYFRELLVRWYQYGVFTPVFRTHGARKNNEPWTMGGDTYRHIRAAILLREGLRPYIMAQMAKASATGLPPMRPLFFDHDEDPNVGRVEDQYLFGRDLIVAPITRYLDRERFVYLPRSSDWVDAWTRRRFKGGQMIRTDAPLDHIPVFVRPDAADGLLPLFSASIE